MIDFEADATDAAIARLIDRVRAANGQIAAQSAHLVQANAARRLHVGYGVRTGTMRRSGRVDGPHQETPDRAWAEAGPTVIYARRFELGFVGPDKKGRVFPYRPRPYWRPAYEESRVGAQQLAVQGWSRAIKEA